ncbi:MAG: hypothetical protein NWS64_03460, partial [Microbacteriaceae bacterium]|nr:hypothetical protein [Microbacteriaceae bacterium]
MNARCGVVGVIVSALLLSGCSATTPAQLDDLRARFIAAGGTCTDWTLIDEPYAEAAATCAEGSTLVVFTTTQNRADFIKKEIETNDRIRARTHVIVSEDTWLVIDTL